MKITRAAHICLFLIALIFLSPIVLTMLLSFLDQGKLSIAQYKRAFVCEEFTSHFLNSVKIAICAVIVHAPVACASGFLLTYGHFRGKQALFAFYILMLLLPFQAIMLPCFRMASFSGLLDTWAMPVLLVVLFPMGPLTIAASLAGVPPSLREAAMLETSAVRKIAKLVLLPQIIPQLAALCLLIFAESWNMVEQPLILISRPDLQPVSLLFNDIGKINLDFAYAGSVLYASPVLICFYGFCRLSRCIDRSTRK